MRETIYDADRPSHRTAIDYAMVIGEMEGLRGTLARMSYFDETALIDEMKKGFYKLYFATRKAEREQAEQ